ncbi:hypothetical protein [Streptomyces sp. NRRL F-5135]|uniref:hypothetical protein n=1 Tax=Streptomyces sp. NRRL F-5135 TaxID=1463858 RepID=UPI0004C9E292|nr:hypothetical protein [Streptomyces sp. NRRL F-5135]
MIEINSQSFQVGDFVHFEAATLPENRKRDYRITAINAHGIEVRCGDFVYGFTRATAARLRITHAPETEE